MNNKNDQYKPYRIILDPKLRIPESSQVVTDVDRSRTVIISGQESQHAESAKLLRERGVQIFNVGMEANRFNFSELWSALAEPSGHFHGLTSLLVEGGRKTWEIFRKAGMLDEEITLVGS
jgi:diaminohydroxyphosphoribosylaminopyrimidine deaminase/5-amino-6-(5-phosphoribosylamino)uracil reductase